MNSRYFSLMAALMFAAVCAYVGAAVFGGTDFGSAPPETEGHKMIELCGIALRHEKILHEQTDFEDGQRLCAAAVSEPYPAQTVIFCGENDGLEFLSPDELEDISAEKMDRLLALRAQETVSFGKLIYGFDWYFAGFLTQGEAPAQNSRCTLRFTQYDCEAEARLCRIIKDGGRTLLVFRVPELTPPLLRVRKSAAVVEY